MFVLDYAVVKTHNILSKGGGYLTYQYGVVGWSIVCDLGISWSCILLIITRHENCRMISMLYLTL